MQKITAQHYLRFPSPNKKSRFSRPVYPPLLCTLDLLNTLTASSDAIYLEKLIGRQDLEAFLCEDATDANLLMKCLRTEMNLKRINVVTVKPSRDQDGEDYP